MSWALKSERVRGFCKLAGSGFQTVGAMKLEEQLPTDLRLCLWILRSFSLTRSFEDWRVLEV